jgi:hypothetical protein
LRIAFLIRRKNYYRPLGPVVEEALRRGHPVECWHDWAQPRSGWKGSEFPDTTPAFRAGVPTVIRFHGLADLADRFRMDPPEAVISVDPPEPAVTAVVKTRWFWLQHSADLVLHPGAPQGLLEAEAVGMYSRWWVDKLAAVHRGAWIADDIARKAVVVGMPELDVLPAIDPDEVRRRYGLPAGRPLVLYLPFPLKSFPPTFWLRNVFRPSNRAAQALRTLLAPRRSYAGPRRAYWPHVVKGWNDRRLVEALGAFCERNGAALVMKSRVKDPVPRYAQRQAAARFDDLSYSPPTILELLRCASLCVHVYSTAVLEAVSCGVPSLCVAPEARDMGLEAFHGDLVHNAAARGIYNWPGAAYVRPLREAFDGFPRWRLDEFPLQTAARREYVERFLGWDDHQSAARFLDLIATRVEG